jgi:hypothetical protein
MLQSPGSANKKKIPFRHIIGNNVGGQNEFFVSFFYHKKSIHIQFNDITIETNSPFS